MKVSPLYSVLKRTFLLSWHFWNYLYKFSLTLLTFLELFVSKCQRVCYYKSKVAQKKAFWVFLYYQKYGIFWSKFIENKLLISGKLLIHNFFFEKKKYQTIWIFKYRCNRNSFYCTISFTKIPIYLRKIKFFGCHRICFVWKEVKSPRKIKETRKDYKRTKIAQ